MPALPQRRPELAARPVLPSVQPVELVGACAPHASTRPTRGMLPPGGYASLHLEMSVSGSA
eukprot:39642-Eustigmatos_ZCMA.PRE.1